MKSRLPALLSMCMVFIAMLACSLIGTNAAPQPENTATLAEPAATEVLSTPLPSGDVVTDPQLTSIHFLDESQGWGVTSRNILRTNDGGATWLDVTPSGAPDFGFGSISYFLDASHGWVAIPNPLDPMEPGQLYRTSDGGAAWEESSFPAGMGGRFSFVDPSNGFYMEDLGAGAGSNWVAIHATADGGASWEPVFSHEPGAPEGDGDLPGSGQKSGMTFRDVNQGWVTGNIPMENYIYLYETTDGGHTWNLQPVEVTSDLGTVFADTYPPVFFGEAGIMPVTLVGNVINLAIYTSADGGSTWTASPAFVANAGRGELVDFVSPMDGFVWAMGRFAVTHDAAQSWETITPSTPFGDNIAAMDFVDTSTGWVLTLDENSHSSFYMTTDGGTTWTTLIP
jgi:photosystem II stability/assembly factor-like uncharacterized protein